MLELDGRRFSTRLLSAICLCQGLPEESSRQIVVGSTGVFLSELVGGTIARQAKVLADELGGQIQIAPSRTGNRVLVAVRSGDGDNAVYRLVHDDEAIDGAPDFSVFRPKPNQTEHDVYHHRRVRRERGFLSRR